MQGRNIEQCIVRSEADAISTANDSAPGAWLLTDLKAAFPSLARAFVWRVLHKAGIPDHILTAIQTLYDKAFHKVLFRGKKYDGFLATGGLFQGCPLSGALFCICIDAFNRMGSSRTRNYLDDFNFVLRNFSSEMPLIQKAFGTLRLASNLSVNFRKCEVICFKEGDSALLQATLRQCAQGWELCQM